MPDDRLKEVRTFLRLVVLVFVTLTACVWALMFAERWHVATERREAEAALTVCREQCGNRGIRSSDSYFNCSCY